LLAEIRNLVYEEIKEIQGGSEGKTAEILDAEAAIWALINMAQPLAAAKSEARDPKY